ncbi:MAG: hypothetical protein POELPBGB_00874 [Bacteroidia bacterium]|nr:hypothetical protein [Bacteroidia bacterium]
MLELSVTFPPVQILNGPFAVIAGVGLGLIVTTAVLLVFDAQLFLNTILR